MSITPGVREALELARLYVDHNEPPAPKDHACGPESQCDALCQDHAEWAADLAKVDAALAAQKGDDA